MCGDRNTSVRAAISYRLSSPQASTPARPKSIRAGSAFRSGENRLHVAAPDLAHPHPLRMVAHREARDLALGRVGGYRPPGGPTERRETRTAPPGRSPTKRKKAGPPGPVLGPRVGFGPKGGEFVREGRARDDRRVVGH